MRWRVDTGYGGYISFDEKDERKAWDLFRELYSDPDRDSVRIRRCCDVFDEGVVVEGDIMVEDLTGRYLRGQEKN